MVAELGEKLPEVKQHYGTIHDNSIVGADVRAGKVIGSIGSFHEWPAELRGYVSLMLASPEPVWMAWGADLTFLYNDAYVPLLGNKHPHAFGASLPSIWSEVWPDVEPLIEQTLAGTACTMTDLQLTVMRGEQPSEAWFTFCYTPLVVAGGAIAGMYCTVRETTDQILAGRRRDVAEAAVLALNETLETQVSERTAERDRMWDTSPDLMVVIDFEGVFQRVNPAWTKVLGYTPEELIGHHVNDFVLPDDHDATVDAYEETAGGGQIAVVNRYRHKDRSIRCIAWTAAPAGNMTYATGRDVTAERSHGVELRRYRDIVDATVAPICAFDRDYRLIAFNKARNDEFRRVNGFDTKIGDVFPDQFIPEQRAVMRALMDRALSGERFTIVEEFGRPELGTPCWEISYTPLHNAAFEVIGAFHQAKDISDRLSAEHELEITQEALRQSQKMETMGQLTGGVAHDFNNLLTPIVGSLDMLMRKGVGTDRERRLIDGALQSAERARMLVQRLLAFARRQPLQPVPVDVGNLITNMAGLLKSTLGAERDRAGRSGTDTAACERRSEPAGNGAG
jgi:PAS domain S-box-containing protein